MDAGLLIMLEPSKDVLYGWTMSDSELDESSEGQREKSVALRIELAGVAEGLRELFNLLEHTPPRGTRRNTATGPWRHCASSKSRDELARTKLRGLKSWVDLFDRGSKFIEAQQHSLA